MHKKESSSLLTLKTHKIHSIHCVCIFRLVKVDKVKSRLLLCVLASVRMSGNEAKNLKLSCLRKNRRRVCRVVPVV